MSADRTAARTLIDQLLVHGLSGMPPVLAVPSGVSRSAHVRKRLQQLAG